MKTFKRRKGPTKQRQPRKMRDEGEAALVVLLGLKERSGKGRKAGVLVMEGKDSRWGWWG